MPTNPYYSASSNQGLSQALNKKKQPNKPLSMLDAITAGVTGGGIQPQAPNPLAQTPLVPEPKEKVSEMLRAERQTSDPVGFANRTSGLAGSAWAPGGFFNSGSNRPLVESINNPEAIARAAGPTAENQLKYPGMFPSVDPSFQRGQGQGQYVDEVRLSQLLAQQQNEQLASRPPSEPPVAPSFPFTGGIPPLLFSLLRPR